MVSGVTGEASFLEVGFKGSAAFETGLALREKSREALPRVLRVPAPFLGLDLEFQSFLESIAEGAFHRLLDFRDGDRGSAREALREVQGFVEKVLWRNHARDDPQPQCLRRVDEIACP